MNNIRDKYLKWHTNAVETFNNKSNLEKIQDQVKLCGDINIDLAKLYSIVKEDVPKDNHGLYLKLKNQINLIQDTEMKLWQLLIMTKADNEKSMKNKESLKYDESFLNQCQRCHSWQQAVTEMYWVGNEDECKETTALLDNHGYIGICDECFDLIGEVVDFGDCIHEGDYTLTGNCRNKPKQLPKKERLDNETNN